MGNFEALTDKVETILASLPIPDDRRRPTRFDAMVLCVGVGARASFPRGLGHLYAMNPATPKQAKRELEAFHSALCTLEKALFGLSSTALEQLDATRKELTDRSIPSTITIHLCLEKYYQDLKEATAQAALKVGESRSSAGRGRRPKQLPKKIADELALYYYWFTGMRPTRHTGFHKSRAYGPFLEFVQKIFDHFGIDGSAQTYAKMAVKEFDHALEKQEQERARMDEEVLKLRMDETHQNS